MSIMLTIGQSEPIIIHYFINAAPQNERPIQAFIIGNLELAIASIEGAPAGNQADDYQIPKPPELPDVSNLEFESRVYDEQINELAQVPSTNELRTARRFVIEVTDDYAIVYTSFTQGIRVARATIELATAGLIFGENQIISNWTLTQTLENFTRSPSSVAIASNNPTDVIVEEMPLRQRAVFTNDGELLSVGSITATSIRQNTVTFSFVDDALESRAQFTQDETISGFMRPSVRELAQRIGVSVEIENDINIGEQEISIDVREGEPIIRAIVELVRDTGTFMTRTSYLNYLIKGKYTHGDLAPTGEYTRISESEFADFSMTGSASGIYGSIEVEMPDKTKFTIDLQNPNSNLVLNYKSPFTSQALASTQARKVAMEGEAMQARFRSSASLSLGDVAILKNMGRDEVIRIDRITQRDRAMPFDYEGRCWSARLGIVGATEQAEFETIILSRDGQGDTRIRIAMQNYSLHSRDGAVHEGNEIQTPLTFLSGQPTRISVILQNAGNIILSSNGEIVNTRNRPANEGLAWYPFTTSRNVVIFVMEYPADVPTIAHIERYY